MPDPLLPADEAVGPLDVAAFERLQDVLARDPTWMDVERLDGYFAARICAPVQTSTGLSFGPVFGVEVLAEAPLGDDLPWVEALLWRHWCTIEFTLRSALLDPRIEYLPLLYEDDTGAVAGNDWARGFVEGMAQDPAAWASFARDMPGALDAVQRLAHEAAAGPRYDAAERAGLVAALAAMLVAAYRHFEPLRG